MSLSTKCKLELGVCHRHEMPQESVRNPRGGHVTVHCALLVATDPDRRTCESLSHTGYGSRVVWFGRACSWAADGWKRLKACPFVNPQTLFF